MPEEGSSSSMASGNLRRTRKACGRAGPWMRRRPSAHAECVLFASRVEGIAARSRARVVRGSRGVDPSARRGADAAIEQARISQPGKMQQRPEGTPRRRCCRNDSCFVAAVREGRGRKMGMSARFFWLLAIGLVLTFALPARAQNADNPECLGTQCGAPQEQGGGGGCGCGCGCGCSVWVSYTDDGKTLSVHRRRRRRRQVRRLRQLPLRRQPRPGRRRRRRRRRRLRQLPGGRQPRPARHRRRRQGRRLRRRQDGDGIANAQDNCPTIPNADQLDTDGDGSAATSATPTTTTTACRTRQDNCPRIADASNPLSIPGQQCDVDTDGDGVDDTFDNCPASPTPTRRTPTTTASATPATTTSTTTAC